MTNSLRRIYRKRLSVPLVLMLMVACDAGTSTGPKTELPEQTAPLTMSAVSNSIGGPNGFEIKWWHWPADSLAATEKAIITRAVSKWQDVLEPSDPWEVPAGILYCPSVPGTTINFGAMGTVIDDISIGIRKSEIDGPGGVWGQAMSCVVRTRGLLPPFGPITVDYLPAYSFIWLDEADVPDMTSDELYDLVLHEMGHALGFGTVGLAVLNLVGDARPPGSALYHDTYFLGKNAIAAFDSVGGGTYSGNKVPLDNVGLRFTAHWRESTMVSELMTPYATSGDDELSLVTVRAFQDLGYEVDVTEADTYTLPTETGPDMDVSGVAYGDDVRQGPIIVVDQEGNRRVVRSPTQQDR